MVAERRVSVLPLRVIRYRGSAILDPPSTINLQRPRLTDRQTNHS